MALFVSLAAWLFQGGGEPNSSHAIIETPSAEPPLEPAGQRWASAQTLAVRTAPSPRATIRAWIGSNEPFLVFDYVDGQGCTSPGWAKTDGGGFVCLKGSQRTQEAPVRLPRLVRFVHPDPSEWEQYLRTMDFDHDPPDKVDAMVPFIYAKRWRGWRGPHYASVAAYTQGKRPLRRLGSGRKYHFVDAVSTKKGPVLLRANGAAVPADQVHIYPLSKYHGWDLNQEPIPPGFLPAWAIDYEGAPIHTEPSHRAPVGARIPHHEALMIEDQHVDKAGHWWMMPNGLGPGIPGYVNDQIGIRHWAPSTEISDIGPGELWLDVDLEQQVLAMRRGSDVEFVTLVSTGELDSQTPRGIFAIQDKAIWTDMASRPASDDPYYVEKVPWVMHFKNRYALHGTFWHWGFGQTASHGCINLSVRDARWIFDRISPTTWGGWSSVLSTQQDPGTTLRIRRGHAPVPDRRRNGSG
jgi:lipoprotein-anchoring transpeptidase ErfK/SrfK